MTLFWIAAGLLLALTLGLLLPALLRSTRPSPRPHPAPLARESANLALLREQLAQLDAERAAGTLDEAAHRAARTEIERRVLDEEGDGTAAGTATAAGARPPAGTPAAPSSAGRAQRTAALLTLFVPTLAIGLYAALGSREALSPQAAAPAPAQVSASDVATMVDQLAQRLEGMAGQPNELEGWVLLARSYASMQRFDEADRAYQRAIALAPQEPQLRADRADVLAMKQGRSLAGEPTRLIDEALQLDPNNLKALVLAGSAAFDRRDYAAAATYWTRARVNVPAGSELAANIDTSLAEARGLAGQGTGGGMPTAPGPGATSGPNPGAGATSAPPKAPQATAPEAPVAAGASASVSGSVSLSTGLAGRVGPDETVFIFARAAEGPRMPLAIRRHRVSELPLRFTLDDRDAMSPELKLSKFPRVVIGARISKSGNAMPQPGDLIATPVATGPGGAELKLVIDQVQP